MKIYAPNKQYTGVSASVFFVNGVGETDNQHLIAWFKEHGYRVEDERSLEKMTVVELRELAKEKGIEGYDSMKKDDLIETLKG